MSNVIKIFENEEFGRVRTIIKDGEPWFVGKDVAEILEYRNTKKALSDHVDEEDKHTGEFDNEGDDILNSYKNQALNAVVKYFEKFQQSIYRDSMILYDGFKTVTGTISKAEKMVDDYLAAMSAFYAVMESENSGRYTYFTVYISNCKNYSSCNDEIFQLIMDYNRLAASENNMFASLIDTMTWLTGKDSFSNHYDLIDSWAEYIYQLHEYVCDHISSSSPITPPAYTGLSVGSKFISGNLTYKVIENGIVEICDCNTSVVSISVGGYVSYNQYDYFITTIGDSAFKDCTMLKEVNMKTSIEAIGTSAFENCTSLETVSVPLSVEKIGSRAFYNCGNLSSIELPDLLKEIGSYTFYGCTNLTSIIIPDSVTSIGNYVFNNCTSLTDVYYTGSETEWNKININSYNSCFIDATIHYNYDPNHTHSYTSKTTKAATCTTDGVKTYTCTTCGATKTEAIKATGHTFGSWTTTKKATCTAAGTQTRKCSLCGTSYKDKYTAKKTVPTVTAKSTYTCTTNAVRINWNKVSGATGYKIYRYNPTTKQWTALKAIYDANTLTYKDSNLKAGTVYKYKVKAFVKSGGKLYFGNSCSTITTATKPTTATITKTAKSSTAVRLYWKKVTCTGYKIQRYNTTTKKWVDVKALSSATTNYRIASLKKNTSYKFRVCAYKNDGKKNLVGAWSYVTVKTSA